MVYSPRSLQRFAFSFLMGTIGLVGLGGTQAIAAETINLTFSTTTIPISIDALETFTAARDLPLPDELQPLLEENPRADTILRETLTREITLSEAMRDRIAGTRKNAVVEMVLSEIDRTITQSDRTTTTDQPIRTALLTALEDDNRLTLLEVLKAYPADEITVDLSRLGPAYANIGDLIDRIQPILDIVFDTVDDFQSGL